MCPEPGRVHAAEAPQSGTKTKVSGLWAPGELHSWHRGAGRDPPFPSPVPRASSVCLALLLMALLSFRHTHSQIEFLLSLGSFYRFCRCRNRVLWHNALLNHFVLPVRPCLPSVPPCFPVVLQPLNPRPGAADLDSDLDKDATAA